MEINANRAEKLADGADRIVALGHVICSITDGADGGDEDEEDKE